MLNTLQEIYDNELIHKPVILKNTQEEYFVLQAPLNQNSSDWYVGLSLDILPSGGFRSKGMTSLYKGNESIWEIFGIE